MNLLRFALTVALLTVLSAPQVGAQHGYSTGDVEHFSQQGSGGGSTGSLPLVVRHTDDQYEIVNGCVVVTRHGRVVAVMPPQHPCAPDTRAATSDPVPTTTITISWKSHGKDNEFPVAVPITVTDERRPLEDADTQAERVRRTVKELLEDWPAVGP